MMAWDVSLHAAVAVHERVYPWQAMVGRRRGDGLGLAEIRVNLREALKEAGHGTGTDCDVAP